MSNSNNNTDAQNAYTSNHLFKSVSFANKLQENAMSVDSYSFLNKLQWQKK